MTPATPAVRAQEREGRLTAGGICVIGLSPGHAAAIAQIAAFLPACFARWRYLQTEREARAEVLASLAAERISRIAIAEDGTVLGWCGGIPEYGGRVWELHPMAVRPGHQRRGVGRALLGDFEAQVRERGGSTVILATDDVDGASSAYGVDLYPEIWRYIRDLVPYADHPFRFYWKCGYVVSGLVPDANGPGKPGILMAKRVAVEGGEGTAPPWGGRAGVPGSPHASRAVPPAAPFAAR
ncbi:MAG: GNAT family N-acetyltransferase [Candidatus Rokubacteria bacterium]|nr:GNAT family N-acetyltransferase [Candidatus Rokubacteria bacterium]